MSNESLPNRLLLGEKLLNFLEVAGTRPESLREDTRKLLLFEQARDGLLEEEGK